MADPSHSLHGRWLVWQAVACLCLMYSADGAWAPASKASIEAAFQADGFKVSQWLDFNGVKGALAESKNATVLGTGLAKKVFYVEGSPAELGYLHGYLSASEVESVAITYVNRFVPTLISPAYAEKHMNQTYMKLLEKLLGDWLVDGSNKQFQQLLQAGDVIPDALVQEMQGVYDGVKAANPSTQVTLERIITINFGMDWFSAKAFTGHILSDLHAYLKLRLPLASAADQADMAFLVEWFRPENAAALRGFFKPPAYCDAFGVQGEGLSPGAYPVYARDFQLVTCDIMQDVATAFIINPSDGRLPTVTVTMPGLIGAITALNGKGVSLGVDTIRSAMGNSSWVGLNSVLLIRHTAHQASSAKEALETMASAVRGTPFLYSTCDSTGDCFIMETGSSLALDQFKPLSYITDEALLKLLPSADFIQQHSSDQLYHNGIFARSYDYKYPDAYLSFNQALFEHAGMPFNASAWGEGGFVFKTWQDERAKYGNKMANNYFPPLRGHTDGSARDYVLVSNYAVVPEMRLTMMSTMDDLIARGGESPQWRYDSLNQLLQEYHGRVDVEVARHIITFLSPDRTPGYWNDTLIPGDPMSAQIEGAIALCDLTPDALRFHVKTGYWTDDWIEMSLLNYLKD